MEDRSNNEARWAGISDQELRDIAVALDSDWENWTRGNDRVRVHVLAQQAEMEISRRGLQPIEEDDDLDQKRFRP